MHARARAICALLCIFLITGTANAFAQTGAPATGTVTGTVATREGTPISGARVTLVSQQRRASAITDALGAFTLSGVVPGTYDVDASAPGYAAISDRTVSVVDRAILSLVLDRETNGSLVQIGEVRATSGETVSSSSAPVTHINAQTAAAAGVASAAAMVWPQLSVTPVLPLGGGDNAVETFALRGPDPTETLVDIDGHQVNNGGTGDFDLSLLDPAALQEVQLLFGISPSALVGPNTLGGAINVITLEPTVQPHALIRGYGGSYNSFGQTLQATGTSGRFGYAVSLHRATSSGSVNGSVVDDDDDTVPVGSAMFGETAISKLRYQLGSGYGYLQASFRDQASNRDLSALLTSFVPPGFEDDARVKPFDDDDDTGSFEASPGTWLANHQSGYGFDAQLPLSPLDANGTPATQLRFSHLTTISSQSVDGPGASTSPYLYNQRDAQNDDWLEIDHHFSKSDLSFKYDILTESLDTQYVAGIAIDEAIPAPGAALMGAQDKASSGIYQIPLSQTQRTAALRYTLDPNEYLHFAAAAYLSDFSTFGSSFDPRIGFTWTPTGNTSIRASVGTTFQAAQLTELIVLPQLPPPIDGVISVGNPNLRPDYATLYDIGGEQIFGSRGYQTHVSLDLYRTNLRSPSAELAVTPIPGCGRKHRPACPIAMPINAGNGVYTGANVAIEQQLGSRFKIRVGWDVDSSYLTVIPPDQQDGTLLAGQQSLGQPLHKAYFGFEGTTARGLSYGANLAYQGTYNELNRPPYATLDAHIAYATKQFQVGVYGTNLTNVYANPFTVLGGGVPYGVPAGGDMIPTPAYVMQGTKIVLVLTKSL
jgi:outer membrane receptor protein involved in Fe transport